MCHKCVKSLGLAKDKRIKWLLSKRRDQPVEHMTTVCRELVRKFVTRYPQYEILSIRKQPDGNFVVDYQPTKEWVDAETKETKVTTIPLWRISMHVCCICELPDCVPNLLNKPGGRLLYAGHIEIKVSEAIDEYDECEDYQPEFQVEEHIQ